ncbi:MAG TPA: DMT family transporter, partial [Bacillota bacterium]|nr:DMT family transporter [Bacillota bacterium]
MRLLVNAFLVILGGCSFGLLAPIVKLGSLNGIAIADSTRMQLFFGFILLAIINLFFVRYRLRPKTFIKLLLSGIPMGLTTTFIYKSLNYLDASIAIVLLFQYVWMGLVVELLITKRAPTKEKLTAGLLILIGSLFAVNIFSTQVSHLPLLGIVWGLLAAVSFATFIFVSGQVATYVPPLRKSMMMALGGLLIILVIYPPTDLAIGKIDGYFLLQGLILGVFGGVLPPLLFSISMPVVGNALGTILSS